MQTSPGSQEDGASWDIKAEEIDDELSIFAGRTKVFRPSGGAIPPQPAAKPESSPISPLPPPADPSGYSYSSSTYPVQGSANVQSSVGGWLSHPDQSGTYQRPNEYLPPPPPQYRYPVNSPNVNLSYTYPPRPEHPSQLDPRQSYSTSDQSHLQTSQGYYSSYMHPEPTYSPPPPELIQLGFAPSSSRLHDNWTSFVHNTGILDNTNA